MFMNNTYTCSFNIMCYIWSAYTKGIYYEWDDRVWKEWDFMIYVHKYTDRQTDRQTGHWHIHWIFSS